MSERESAQERKYGSRQSYVGSSEKLENLPSDDSDMIVVEEARLL